MRQVNITLDLYSMAICLILFLYLCFGRSRKDRLRQYLALMCLFNIGMLLGDTVTWATEGLTQPIYSTLLWVASLLYYISSGPLLLAFVGYVIESVSDVARVGKRLWYAAVGLCAFQVLFGILSLWNGMYYTISADNYYVRGHLFWLSQIIPFLIYGISVFLLIRYARYLRRRDLLFLYSHIILPLAAEIIQIFNYGTAPLNTGITFALLLVFINIQFTHELRTEQQERELAEARIDITLSQIQPHFLYNTLTAIRHLCGSDPKRAKEAILDFSLFLRGNMNALTSKTPIPFEQERMHTEKYLSLEQQRMQNRLRVVYDIGVSDFSIPPLTLQPIVENAVRHGVLRREEGGTITIGTTETPLAHIITISDDGVGFQPNKEEPKDRIHVGIANVQKRLADLCSGELVIKSTLGIGTVATITIPK